MKSIEFSSKVVNNKLVSNLNRLKEVISSFNGKDILIKVSLLEEKRSNNQNRYYWGVIIPLVRKGLEDLQGCLFSSDEVHSFLKSKFNVDEKVDYDTGKIFEVPKSTTDNSTKDMEDYHTKIREFSKSYLNVEIPMPNEQLIIK